MQLSASWQVKKRYRRQQRNLHNSSDFVEDVSRDDAIGRAR